MPTPPKHISSVDDRRAYERQWRKEKWANDPEYRARKKATDKAWRDRMRQELREYKLAHGCVVCGYDKCSRALHFHHRGDDKELTIGNAIYKGRIRIWAEVEKCDVLCSNCHSEQHCTSC